MSYAKRLHTSYGHPPKISIPPFCILLSIRYHQLHHHHTNPVHFQNQKKSYLMNCAARRSILTMRCYVKSVDCLPGLYSRRRLISKRNKNKLLRVFFFIWHVIYIYVLRKNKKNYTNRLTRLPLKMQKTTTKL